MTQRPRLEVLATAALVAVAVNAVGCSVGQAKRELAGGATTSGKQVLDRHAQPPRQVYVADFAIEEGAIKPSSGLIAEGEQVLRKRPRLLGGGGILGRRTASDFPVRARW